MSPWSAPLIASALPATAPKTSLMSVSPTMLELISRSRSAWAARRTACRRSRSSSRVMYPVARATTRNRNTMPMALSLALGSEEIVVGVNEPPTNR